MRTATEVIALGGANFDIKANVAGDLTCGTSNAGTVTFAAGGVARNIAHNLGRLGVPVALVSAVGDDALGTELIRATEAAGVDCTLVMRTRDPTGSYVAVLDAQGEMRVAVNAMPAMDRLMPAMLEQCRDRLDSATFVFADCNLPRASLEWLARYARKLIIDPVSLMKSEKLPELPDGEVFAITLNRCQAEHLVKTRIGNIAEARAAADALHGRGFVHLVMTLGSDGAVASRSGHGSVHIPAFTRMARDVTGGGDAATAGLIFGLLQGADLAEATRLGQAAASLAVSAMDTVSSELTPARLLSLISSPIHV